MKLQNFIASYVAMASKVDFTVYRQRSLFIIHYHFFETKLLKVIQKFVNQSKIGPE